MKYMVKSKILATFCAGLLTVSTGIQAAERLATGTQQKQAQKTVIETSPWFDDKDLTLTGVYYYPEHWDESQWERDFKKMHELGFEFTHFAEFAWAQLEPEEGRYDFAWLDRAVALAAKYDLKVIMCTSTATPPVWMSRKYPEILLKNEDGTILDHGARQHASFASPLYRELSYKMIEKLAQKHLQLTLSVSLHAPTDEMRSSMMPVNDVYPVEQLIRACRDYQQETGRRVSFEYSMVNGVNDSPQTARRLAQLIKGMGAHVNLIPINPVDGSPYSATDAANVKRFQTLLTELGVNATVRRRLGSEISAACGQLRRDEMNGKA